MTSPADPSPRLPPWWNAEDPWLAARMRRVTQIKAAETDIGRAVLRAMADYLDQARAAVLGERAPAVTAAAADEPPDLDAWPGLPLWLRLVRQFVMPVVGAVFSLAFGEQTPRREGTDQPPPPGGPDEPEPAPTRGRIVSDDRHYQRAYLDKVESRLVLWPDGAFEQLRTELQAGLALGEDIRALRDRIGRTLTIDAPSRALAAKIDRLTRTITDPDTPPQVAREARARRAALYRDKDRADQRWWPSAARIARTEAVTALNGGTYAGAANAAEIDGAQRWVQWWATTDDRVRPSHWAAHMQVRELGEKFLVGGVEMDHPGDPEAPADEVINCRCSVLVLNTAEDVARQRDLYDRMLPGRTDIQGRPIDADGRVIDTDARQGGTAVLDTAAPAAVVAATDDRTVDVPPPDREHPVRHARWRSPIERLGGTGGYVPMPTGEKLRHRSLPAALLWQREAAHGNDIAAGAVDVGRVTTADIETIDGSPWITGDAEIDMGNPDGRELARRMDGGFLRWISIMIDRDPDAVADRILLDDETEPAGDVDPDTWRLGNVTVLAQPEFDEATIELVADGAADPETDDDRDPEDARPVPAVVAAVTASGETDGMVALIPAEPDALTVPEGDPADQLHLTLAYLGEVVDWPEKYREAVHEIAARATGAATDEHDEVPASVSRPLTANVFSHAVFNPNNDNGRKPATVYLFDGEGDRAQIEMLAAEVRNRLADALGTTDFPEQHEPFVPHVTAGYGLPVETLTYTGPVVFDRLRVALGDTVTDYPLGAADAVTAAVTGDTGLPIADRHRAWNSSTARKRVMDWARDAPTRMDPEKMSRAFLWRDPDGDPASVGSYKFGVADMIGGRLMIVPRGVFAAAAALQGARGGTTVPEADQARMRTKINGLYRRMREAWDDPSLTPPWETATSSGTARRRPGEHRPGVIVSSNQLTLVAASGSAVENLRQSWAHRLAEVANTLYEPDASWFRNPELKRRTPLTFTPEGRVFGHAHDWKTEHVGYADRRIRALRDREDYRAFNLRPVRCKGGEVVRAGALCKGGHASTEPGTTAYAAQAHYDDPAKRLARVTAGRDEHGTWVAGALVPGVSPRDLLDLAELSLSPDWRDVDLGRGEGKFVGISVVNAPGLPILVPDEELGGYDTAAALVAAGTIVRERPAWADEADGPVLDDLAQRFGERAGDAAWQRLLDHLTASGATLTLDEARDASGLPAEPVTASAQQAGGDPSARLAELARLVNTPDAPVTAAAAPPPAEPSLAELARLVNGPAATTSVLAALAVTVNAPTLAALAGEVNQEAR